MGDSARNASLDALRTVAVLAVFEHHLPLLSQAFWGVAEVGARGVDLFFVLSGYLIGSIALRAYFDNDQVSLVQFWRDRWFRTLPAYYVTLLIYLGKEVLTGHAFATFAPYLYFFQSYAYAPGQLPRFNHSWSLAVEEHFYLALPILLLFAKKLQLRRTVMPLVIGVGLALFAWRTVLLCRGEPLQIKLSTWRTDGLLVGVVLAWLARAPRILGAMSRGRHVIALMAVLVLAAAGWMQFHDSQFDVSVFALGCGLLVILGIVHYEPLERLGRVSAVAWIARISYSFYLLHPLVIVQLRRAPVFEQMTGLPGWLLFAAVSAAMSLAAAQLCYMFVERPGLALRDRLRKISDTRKSGSALAGRT